MEIGPWRMDGKGGLKLIEGGWDEYAHVLFRSWHLTVTSFQTLNLIISILAVDQPVGTGYSYGSTDGYVHDLDQVSFALSKPRRRSSSFRPIQVSVQVNKFLQNFYDVFPEMALIDVRPSTLHLCTPPTDKLPRRLISLARVSPGSTFRMLVSVTVVGVSQEVSLIHGPVPSGRYTQNNTSTNPTKRHRHR